MDCIFGLFLLYVSPHGLYAISWRLFFGRSLALWDNVIEDREISVGNLMYAPFCERGVLDDFNLARLGEPDRKPSTKDNAELCRSWLWTFSTDRLWWNASTDTAPSLSPGASYICVSVTEDNNNQIDTCSNPTLY